MFKAILLFAVAQAFFSVLIIAIPPPDPETDPAGSEKYWAEANMNFMKKMKNKELPAKIVETDLTVIGADPIGIGSYAKVFLVNHNPMSTTDAMKKPLNTDYKEIAMNELRIMNAIEQDHPFLMNLKYTFEDKKKICLVMQYCSEGDMLAHIRKNVLNEADARFYIAELVIAIDYLHNVDCIYRDLKLDNILIDSEGHIKLTDFGLTKFFDYKNSLRTTTKYGVPLMTAPEMPMRDGKDGSYDKAVDLWSIGLTLSFMITGRRLSALREPNLTQQSVNLKIELSALENSFGITKECIEVLQKLIEPNEIDRMTIPQLKKHSWFKLKLGMYPAVIWEDVYNKKAPGPLAKKEVQGNPTPAPVDLADAEIQGDPTEHLLKREYKATQPPPVNAE